MMKRGRGSINQSIIVLFLFFYIFAVLVYIQSILLFRPDEDVNIVAQDKKCSSTKIDIIIAWINKTDICEGTDSYRCGKSRFTSRDELRYLMRSIEKYCPWVRNIYLVTDNQKPSWLNTSHPRVFIVDQSSLFDNPEIPIHNSAAIEWNLHKIKGLSEKFVYFNDDFLVMQPTCLDDFFIDNKPTVRLESWTTAFYPYLWIFHLWFGQLKSTINLLPRNLLGFKWYRLYQHAPHSFTKSQIEELWKTFPDIAAKTSSSQFRASTDVILAFLYTHYFLNKGEAVDVTDSEVNVRIDSYMQNWDLMEAILSKMLKPKFVTIQDCSEISYSILRYFKWVEGCDKVFPRMEKFYNTLFPNPSSFELL
jgi:hypothetical protein